MKKPPNSSERCSTATASSAASLGVPDAHPAVAGVAFDEHAQRPPGARRPGRDWEDVAVVHHHGHRRAFEQTREPRELEVAEHVRRQEQVVESRSGHRLGFADRLAGEADSAELELAAGDLDALVVLMCGRPSRPSSSQRRCQRARFRSRPVQVDDRRRRLHVERAHVRAGRRPRSRRAGRPGARRRRRPRRIRLREELRIDAALRPGKSPRSAR